MHGDTGALTPCPLAPSSAWVIETDDETRWRYWQISINEDDEPYVALIHVQQMRGKYYLSTHSPGYVADIQVIGPAFDDVETAAAFAFVMESTAGMVLDEWVPE